MKVPIISSILITALVFTACGGSQNVRLEKQDALQIEKASYHKWSSGVQGGGWGYNAIITLKDNEKKEIRLDSIYFKKFKSAFVLNELGEYRTYMAVEKSTLGSFPNLGGTNEKVEDKVKVDKQHEFQLIGNEAILLYTEGSKKKYYKLILEEDKSVQLPR